MINSRKLHTSANCMSNWRHWMAIIAGRAWRRYSTRRWRRNAHVTLCCPPNPPVSPSASLPRAASSVGNAHCHVASIVASIYSKINVRCCIVPVAWSVVGLCAKNQWLAYSRTPLVCSIWTWQRPSVSTYKRCVKQRLSLTTTNTTTTTKSTST